MLAFVSVLAVLWRLRARRDLLAGTAALFVLLLVEADIGGAIGDHPNWPTAHIPLAMALMALSVWLPSRAIRTQRPATHYEPATRRDGASTRDPVPTGERSGR